MRAMVGMTSFESIEEDLHNPPSPHISSNEAPNELPLWRAVTGVVP